MGGSDDAGGVGATAASGRRGIDARGTGGGPRVMGGPTNRYKLLKSIASDGVNIVMTTESLSSATIDAYLGVTAAPVSTSSLHGLPSVNQAA